MLFVVGKGVVIYYTIFGAFRYTLFGALSYTLLIVLEGKKSYTIKSYMILKDFMFKLLKFVEILILSGTIKKEDLCR